MDGKDDVDNRKVFSLSLKIMYASMTKADITEALQLPREWIFASHIIPRERKYVNMYSTPKYEEYMSMAKERPPLIAKYAIYLRKSRDDIHKESQGAEETLAKHKRILTDLAARQGLFVEKIYEEVVSGETIEAREQIQELIKDCYAGKYRGIIVIEITRLSRGNQGDAQVILDCLKYANNNQGLLVITPTKTYDIAHNSDDEEFLEFELFMSRREYKMIKKRLDRGKKQEIVEGAFMATYRPYGYNIVRTAAIRTLEPVPEEAEIVKLIFEWAVHEEMTGGQISRKLTAMGVPTYTGVPEWTTATIKEILQNPTYTGKVRWNHRMQVKTMEDGKLVTTRPRSDHTDQYMLYEGKHPAIISDELFNAVNNRPKAPKAKALTELKNPLAGILVCAKCGYAMPYHGGYPSRNVQARFNHRHSTLCKVRSVFFSDVMDALIFALKQHIADFEMKIDNLPVIDTSSILRQQEALKLELRKLQGRMNKLFEGWEDGAITNNEFVERKAANAEKIENVRRQLELLEAEMPTQAEYQEQVMKLTDALEILQDKELDAETKNKYLKKVIARIAFSRENQDSFILDIDLI